MNKIKKLLKIIKQKKGITGADIAAAVTVIVLTVGIVTAIYVNAINKSKDNMRYANAVRIATNIIENIQRKPYEYLTAMCKGDDNTCKITGSSTSNNKIFDTKVPNGFSVTVLAQKPSVSEFPVDVARDVTVSVKYRANSTYKTISLKTVKEKELMDMTNPPDFSLIPNYNPSNTSKFYYPVSGTSSNYKITTTSDVNWYDYEDGNYAIVYESSNGSESIGKTVPSGSKMYVWIPRFVTKKAPESKITDIQFLYGASNYPIVFKQYGNLFSYGLEYDGSIEADSTPKKYNETLFQYSENDFKEDDGLSGVWYKISGDGTNSEDIQKKATTLNSKIKCNNAEIK